MKTKKSKLVKKVVNNSKQLKNDKEKGSISYQKIMKAAAYAKKHPIEFAWE